MVAFECCSSCSGVLSVRIFFTLFEYVWRTLPNSPRLLVPRVASSSVVGFQNDMCEKGHAIRRPDLRGMGWPVWPSMTRAGFYQMRPSPSSSWHAMATPQTMFEIIVRRTALALRRLCPPPTAQVPRGIDHSRGDQAIQPSIFATVFAGVVPNLLGGASFDVRLTTSPFVCPPARQPTL